MFGNAFAILWIIPFVLSTIYFGIRKGENNYYETDKYDGNGTATRRIVIFGATGDLCKRKLIPALYELWKKELLPQNILIVGASRREHTKESWLQHLGDYPEEFCHWLDFVSCDLDNPESLNHLHDDSADTTYFLSVPPERYENAIINLKERGFLDDPDHSRVVIEKPFGHDLESADHLQSVVGRYLREKSKFIALIIILAKILLTIFLLQGLVIFSWNHFGIGST